MFFVLALLSGLLVGTSFLIPHGSFLALFGITPLFYVLEKATPRKALLYGFVSSITFVTCALFAVFLTPLPLDWMNLDIGNLQYTFGITAWLISSSIFAFQIALWALFVKTKTNNSWMDFLTIPAAWTLAEWTGAFLFSLFNYAPGTAIGAHFSLSFIGNTLADSFVLRHIAWLGGIYLLSASIIACNLLVFRIWSGMIRGRTLMRILGALFLLWCSAWIILSFLPTPMQKVRIVAITTQIQPTFSLAPEMYARHLSSVKTMYEEAISANADIILFPEGSQLFVPRDEQGRLVGMRREDGIVPSIITSGKELRDEHTLSRMEYYDLESGQSAQTYKYLPQPLGEYMTYSAYYVGSLLGARDAMERIGLARNFVSGHWVTPIYLQSTVLGALFCNETISPELYRSLAYQGAEIFLNASSQDWFHESHLVFRQMLRAAQIRAVENHRPYVQASNTSPSFALDANGRILGATAWSEEGILLADVSRSNTLTLYTLVGTKILIISFVLVMYALYVHEKPPFARRSKQEPRWKLLLSLHRFKNSKLFALANLHRFFR